MRYSDERRSIETNHFLLNKRSLINQYVEVLNVRQVNVKRLMRYNWRFSLVGKSVDTVILSMGSAEQK